MRKLILLLLGIFMGIMCIVGIFSLFVILWYADFQHGKVVVIFICFLIIAGFGMATFKCFKFVFHRDITEKNFKTTNQSVRNTHIESQKTTPIPVIEANNMHREILQKTSSELMDKINDTPNEVQDLLWIKSEKTSYEHNLLNEPSLIDTDLEIKYGEPIQDIGYYPSYRNLKAENRYVYLNWLRDVTAPIPIGYVFIFYYGLERHLIFGKFEQAFKMIIKLRQYHTNESFYAYSSDALLIAILFHKRIDLISKIDLNKATPQLSQFIIASLTGRIDSTLLIDNSKDVGFANQRYIKNDYELFKIILEQVLQEKFGCSYYPVSEDDFSECKDTFPLVLANYSLNMNERIVNAPDISTNKKYRQTAFEILSETHERVKAHKKIERSKKNST